MVAALAVPGVGVAHEDPQYVAPGPATANDPSATPAYGSAPAQSRPASPPPAASRPASPPPAPQQSAPARVTPASTPAEASRPAAQRRPAARSETRAPARREAAPRRVAERQPSAPVTRPAVPVAGGDLPATAPQPATGARARAGAPAQDAPAPAAPRPTGGAERDAASATGGGADAGARVRPPAIFTDPLLPLFASVSATADGDEGPPSWALPALGGLGMLLIVAAGTLVLAGRRRRPGEPDDPQPKGAVGDEIEAALQELLAEERARETTRTGLRA